MELIIVKRNDGQLVSWDHVRCNTVADMRRVQADAPKDAMVTPLSAREFGAYQEGFNARMKQHKEDGWLAYDAKMWSIDDLAILDDCHLCGVAAVNAW